MRNWYLTAMLLTCATALSVPSSVHTVSDVQKPIASEPGGTDSDTSMAVNDPFEYAWRLFMFLNRQAANGVGGIADPAKADLRAYDDDRPVVWETWAVATGGLFLASPNQNTSEVFRFKGETPVLWDQLPRGAGAPAKRLEPTLTNFADRVTTGAMRPNAQGQFAILSVPINADSPDDEVRMNRSTYETIRGENLYSMEGLAAKFDQAKQSQNFDLIKFDRMSKEIKARWIPITEAQKSRYHWRTIQVTNANGSTESRIFGLAALHIITKDLPNWFWTDFSHVDQEPLAVQNGRPFVDPTTRGQNASHGANGVRNETLASKWSNYRLSGVQVDFVDKTGTSTRLANELIEPIDSGPSSCITCHAKATVGGINRITPPLGVKAILPTFTDGVPLPAAYRDAQGRVQFIQTDFLWSMAFRAHSKTEK
jgi:hypothetical protein